MNVAIWASIVSVVGMGLLSLIGAIVMGKIVPHSRVVEVQKDLETTRQAYTILKEASDKQLKLLERQQITAEVTDKVMSAVRDQIRQVKIAGENHDLV